MLRNPGRPISIYEIAECVGVAFEKSMTPKNITAGFKKSGIFPFDKNIFTDDDYIVSSVTDRCKPADEVAGPSNIEDHITGDCGDEPFETHKADNRDCNGKTIIETPKTDIQESKLTKETNIIENFISPVVLKGYPKAPELKQKNRIKKKEEYHSYRHART